MLGAIAQPWMVVWMTSNSPNFCLNCHTCWKNFQNLEAPSKEFLCLNIGVPQAALRFRVFHIVYECIYGFMDHHQHFQLDSETVF